MSNIFLPFLPYLIYSAPPGGGAAHGWGRGGGRGWAECGRGTIPPRHSNRDDNTGAAPSDHQHHVRLQRREERGHGSRGDGDRRGARRSVLSRSCGDAGLGTGRTKTSACTPAPRLVLIWCQKGCQNDTYQYRLPNHHNTMIGSYCFFYLILVSSILIWYENIPNLHNCLLILSQLHNLFCSQPNFCFPLW